jgi:hypothetical protein
MKTIIKGNWSHFKGSLQKDFDKFTLYIINDGGRILIGKIQSDTGIEAQNAEFETHKRNDRAIIQRISDAIAQSCNSKKQLEMA